MALFSVIRIQNSDRQQVAFSMIGDRAKQNQNNFSFQKVSLESYVSMKSARLAVKLALQPSAQ